MYLKRKKVKYFDFLMRIIFPDLSYKRILNTIEYLY